MTDHETLSALLGLHILAACVAGSVLVVVTAVAAFVWRISMPPSQLRRPRPEDSMYVIPWILGMILAAVVILALITSGCATGPSSGWSPSPPTPPVVVPPTPPPPVDPPAPPATVGRHGPVRLEGHALADDDGPFPALGATLFWALWAEKHDPEKLERNLAYLAAHRVDYIRILTMVGNGAIWADRRIVPQDGDYWSVVDRLFTRLRRHGIRVHLTIFADAQVMMPNAGDRDAWVDRWMDEVNARIDQVAFIEMANEYWQNGFANDEAGLRRLGDRARARTRALVALSAPPDDAVFSVYGGWPGPATMHYDRDVRRSDGFWRPVRQPYGCWNEYREREAYTGPTPPTCINAEPIGPQSSVAEDADPTRLALAYVTSLVVGNGAYTYHTGAGIGGGGAGHVARGRFADLMDYDPAILAAMRVWRERLPGNVATGARTAAHLSDFPWNGSSQAVEAGLLVRAYGTQTSDTWTGVLLGVSGPHTITARRAFTIALLHPLTGDTIAGASLAAGQSWTVPASASGFVVTVR
jgi:hypothetical protein